MVEKTRHDLCGMLSGADLNGRSRAVPCVDPFIAKSSPGGSGVAAVDMDTVDGERCRDRRFPTAMGAVSKSESAGNGPAGEIRTKRS